MNEFLLSVEQFRHLCINSLRQLDELAYRYRAQLSTVFLGLIFMVFVIYLVGIPVTFTDTDMWYHLAGGRYTLENWRVNNSTFFSFVTPEREWINYFWGFQVLLYKVHELFGYQGLILLRVIFYTTIAILIIKIMLHSNQGQHASLLQLTLIALVLYLLAGRVWGIRPHMVSYLFILVFIYTLFFNQKRIYLLPLFTLFWINMHGIEWVVAGLICGAFVLQRFFEYMQSRDSALLRPVIWVFICIPAMFINPYGYQILTAPFNVSSDAHYFIRELQGLNLGLHNAFDSTYVLTELGSILILIVTVSVSLLVLWLSGKLNIALLLLSLGGFLLLIRGYRFVWEWALLLLPVLALVAGVIKEYPVKAPYYLRMLGVVYMLFSLSMMTFRSTNFEEYPLDENKLPVASTQFIKKMGLSGKYFTNPNYGGYIEWELYSEVSIFMDMEFPPFDDYDFLVYLLSVTSKTGMEGFLNKYEPELIALDRRNPLGNQLIKEFKDYVPVMIEDSVILYVNKNSYSKIADKYQIKNLDLSDGLLGHTDEGLEAKLEELERLLSIEKRNPYVISVLAMSLLDSQQLDRARPWVDLMLHDYSSLPLTYYLVAVARYYDKDFESSIGFLEQALSSPWVDENRKKVLYKQLALNYYQLQDYERAYDYFEESINMYYLEEKNKTYYQYAYSAFVVDDVERARRLCKLILHRAKKDGEAYKNAQDLLGVIEKGEYGRALWKHM